MTSNKARSLNKSHNSHLLSRNELGTVSIVNYLSVSEIELDLSTFSRSLEMVGSILILSALFRIERSSDAMFVKSVSDRSLSHTKSF